MIRNIVNISSQPYGKGSQATEKIAVKQRNYFESEHSNLATFLGWWTNPDSSSLHPRLPRHQRQAELRSQKDRTRAAADVAKVLQAWPHNNPECFFWSGKSKVQAAASVWRKRIADVFKAAKMTDGHGHRFRDTFAVDLLQRGVSLESVSRLLGHQSIRITEKHYSPWVKTRQEALEKEVSAALSN